MSNNPKNPQHAFYIGDNVSEDIVTTYQDSLVFDRERNSIYAKNHEFGYISDFNNSIKLRNADNTNETTITLTVVDGQIQFYEYRTPLITSYFPNYRLQPGITYVTSNGCSYTLTLGSYGYIDSIYYSISGSETCDIIEVKRRFNNYNNVLYYNDNEGIVENPTLIVRFDEQPDNMKYFSSNTAGTYDIASIYIEDPKGAFNEKTITVTFYNNVMLYKWSKDSNDFYGLQNIINSQNTLESICNTLGNTTLYNKLLNSNAIGTIKCDNGPDVYLALCCPQRVFNKDKFTGILGGAAVQEFKYIKTVTYTNSASYTENYNIYLATGHNWDGQSLKI